MASTIAAKITLSILAAAVITAIIYSLISVTFFKEVVRERHGPDDTTSTESEERQLRALIKKSLGTGIVLALLFIPLAIVIAHSISDPILQLKRASSEIAAGKLDTAIKIKSSDEIGALAEEFKTMAQSLSTSQERLEHFNEELEEKVAERTKELEEATMKIKRLLYAKSQFVNQVAHDLRTPLVPIMGLLPMLQEDLEKGATEENQKVIETVMNNATYLSTLVKDTLNIARLDAGKLTINKKAEDVTSVVKEIIQNNQIVLDQHKVSVKNEVPDSLPHVEIDRMRILEIFENLVMNATKFMQEKKELTFGASVEDGFIVMSLADTGIGIKKEHLDKIFEEFQKLDQSRHVHSSGLGLSICRRIVELHGGKIWAESPGLGEGSTFKFTLPISKG